MPTPLTIVAKIVARPGAETQLDVLLRALVAPSRADPGCLQYDLHRSCDDPRLFLFFENWATRADWDAHMQTPHLDALRAASDALVESVELLPMERLA